MDGLVNFRDFGGLPTLGGGAIAKARLFRSGHHAGLNDAALGRILALDFDLIVDLRYPDERRLEPSPWPQQWASRVIAHDAESRADAPHMGLFEAATISPDAIDESYRALYRALPFDPAYRPVFTDAIRRMAEHDGPFLIHCAAGKDRTGVLVGLLLHVLEAEPEAIEADYLKSSGAPTLQSLRPALMAKAMRDTGVPLSDAAVDAILGVKADYLRAMYTEVSERCGSVEAYLQEGGVGPEIPTRLRQRLTSD